MLASDFKNFRKPYHPKSLGAEIEVANIKPNTNGIYQGLNRAGQWLLKADASLPHTGCEFVSQPLVPESLKRHVRWLERKVGGSFEIDSSCGLHIHADRSWIDEGTAYGIFSFIKKMPEDVFKKWAGRGRNEYTEGTIESHYGCINTRNKSTYEFRIFAAGDNSKWVERCIDLVTAMLLFNGWKNVPVEVRYKKFIRTGFISWRAADSEPKQQKELFTPSTWEELSQLLTAFDEFFFKRFGYKYWEVTPVTRTQTSDVTNISGRTGTGVLWQAYDGLRTYPSVEVNRSYISRFLRTIR